MGSRPVVFKTRWWTLLDPSAAPTRGPAIDVIFKTRWWTLSDPPVVPLRGPAIDVFFKLNGGRCQTHWQRPLGARH
jgi:hypothetical protein